MGIVGGREYGCGLCVECSVCAHMIYVLCADDRCLAVLDLVWTDDLPVLLIMRIKHQVRAHTLLFAHFLCLYLPVCLREKIMKKKPILLYVPIRVFEVEA